MKKLFQISLWFLFVSIACAQGTSAPKQKVLRVYDWKDLNVQSPNCQIVSMDGMSVLKIENTNDAPSEISLLTITNSLLFQRTQMIESEMKYENVHGLLNSTILIITWGHFLHFLKNSLRK